MPKAKILFLRVGIDRGCGGRLSPVEADGKFEYVSIPEGAPVHNALRYADIPSRRGGTLAQVIGMDASVDAPNPMSGQRVAAQDS